jgi:hypothetical protein
VPFHLLGFHNLLLLGFCGVLLLGFWLDDHATQHLSLTSK